MTVSSYSPELLLGPSADSRRAVVSYWRKNVHLELVNCLGGLPRNSVVRVNDRARNDLNMLKGRKTVIKPKQNRIH